MVEENSLVIVGVNKFESDDYYIPENILKVDPELEEKQKRRLKDLRKRRDEKKVRMSIERLKEVAKTSENIMYPIIDAVRNYATVGEISDALREVFGEYRERTII
jgi:methylmalonyl-CoA mutase N-terminal domain/subunit